MNDDEQQKNKTELYAFMIRLYARMESAFLSRFTP